MPTHQYLLDLERIAQSGYENLKGFDYPAILGTTLAELESSSVARTVNNSTQRGQMHRTPDKRKAENAAIGELDEVTVRTPSLV